MIFVGKIVKTRGNKGEVAVAPSPHFDLSNSRRDEKIFLISKKHQIDKYIEYIRDVNGSCIFKFKDIDSISQALKFIGYSIFTDENADTMTPVLSIVDFKVLDVKGTLWGRVRAVDSTAAQHLVEVVDNNNDKLIHVPFVPSIVIEIDHNERRIIIDPPDGLSNLNR